MRSHLVSLICLFLLTSSAMSDDRTWLEIDGVVYGAKPDKLGPLGGGKGYANVVTKGDYTAGNLDALLDASAYSAILAQA